VKALRTACVGLLAVWGAVALAQTASGPTAPASRIAVISAYEPEATRLLAQLKDRQDQRHNGTLFSTGILEGKPVVLFLSGVSMVNAAMNTQLVLERYRISHIVYSGIAGGVNPALHIGDVTVASRWAQYLESFFARETAPGKYSLPGWTTPTPYANYGMMHPQAVGVRSVNDRPSAASAGGPANDRAPRKFWFDVDARMLKAAESLTTLKLAQCNAQQKCLSHAPKVVLGGSGVSGSAFIDNKAFREYTFATFGANVLDMETAATAQVAHANGVPYIAFRSLSDLAGGGEGENEIGTFFQVAADNAAQVVLHYLRHFNP
jgi:adenosylhomocysteine nucleosidase